MYLFSILKSKSDLRIIKRFRISGITLYHCINKYLSLNTSEEMNRVLPIKNELPSHFADRLGINYTKSVTPEHKKSQGQFFTPLQIAQMMVSLCDSDLSRIEILDPGCGTCILSCCLIERLVEHNNRLKSIRLVAYETDPMLIPYSNQILEYLKEWLQSHDIDLVLELRETDFVLDNSATISENGQLFDDSSEQYDMIISNPPYFKLSKDDKRTQAVMSFISGQTNIYSLFMGISARLLKPFGQFIFITPRSFASGNYFKSFREKFFSEVQIEKVHLFTSRRDTFNRDSVLQETVVIKAVKKKEDNPNVTIYSSHGLRDIDSPTRIDFSHNDLMDPESTERFLFLPTSEFEESILELVKSWSGNLREYNIQISTGPVVSFRAKDLISESIKNGNKNFTALYWLHNARKMQLNWPIHKQNKGQYIVVSQESYPILIPNKNYILLRRFSSKDDKSRLIAAPYFRNFTESDYIGVENKLNYIYRKTGHLDRNEIVGLCALLNSDLFDTYFRMFNGNVNVSATELRNMNFPPIDIIKEIGNNIILLDNYSEEYANDVVNQYFEVSELLSTNEEN